MDIGIPQGILEEYRKNGVVKVEGIISRDEAAHRIAQWEMAVAQVRLPTTRGH